MKISGAISGKYPTAAAKLAPIMGKLPIKIGQAMIFRTPYSPRRASVMPLARAHQIGEIARQGKTLHIAGPGLADHI